MTEEKIAEIPHYRTSTKLSEREKAAIHYAEVLAGNHHSADRALFDELRRHFTASEIIDLGIRIMTFIGYGRLIYVLGLEIGGTCPMPPPKTAK
ncbi:MAG TPA: hypothetical protein PJ986_02630 [Gammaproteobacteria bacterium]|nr:hypothetical protein [Gammaproteobacteria bacterium]